MSLYHQGVRYQYAVVASVPGESMPTTVDGAMFVTSCQQDAFTIMYTLRRYGSATGWIVLDNNAMIFASRSDALRTGARVTVHRIIPGAPTRRERKLAREIIAYTVFDDEGSERRQFRRPVTTVEAMRRARDLFPGQTHTVRRPTGEVELHLSGRHVYTAAADATPEQRIIAVNQLVDEHFNAM